MCPPEDPRPEDPRFVAARARMVAEQLSARGIHSGRVLAAMSSVPRQVFVARQFWNEAYEDHPVPIGEGQTISQPYIVAAMLESLSVEPEDRVLEVGTGTGYQAALLGYLAHSVVSIERQPQLAEDARSNLALLAYSNVEVITGDGSLGYPPRAPYDRIIVAAASPALPRGLFEQLAEGGRMIVPVGNRDAQVLRLVRKIHGEPHVSDLEACRFVPLLGESGFKL